MRKFLPLEGVISSEIDQAVSLSRRQTPLPVNSVGGALRLRKIDNRFPASGALALQHTFRLACHHASTTISSFHLALARAPARCVCRVARPGTSGSFSETGQCR